MRTIQPGLWLYRDHLIIRTGPETYTVYWQVQHGWELWDSYPSLRRVKAAIECVTPSTERYETVPAISGG